MSLLGAIHRWRVGRLKQKLAGVSAQIDVWLDVLSTSSSHDIYCHNQLSNLRGKKAELQEQLKQLLK